LTLSCSDGIDEKFTIFVALLIHLIRWFFWWWSIVKFFIAVVVVGMVLAELFYFVEHRDLKFLAFGLIFNCWNRLFPLLWYWIGL
jgi:hypothetical protein